MNNQRSRILHCVGARSFWRSGVRSLLGVAMLNVIWTASAQVQQAWVARYDYHNSIDSLAAMTTDGAGSTYVTGVSDGQFATAKYSPTGSQLWSARYLGPGSGIINSYPVAMAVDQAGNVGVTGTAHSTDYYERTFCDEYGQNCHTRRIYYDVFQQATVKYDPGGKKLWDTASSHGSASGIALDNTGDVIVTSSDTLVFDATGNPIFSSGGTVKYDANGNQLWVRAGGIALAVDGANNVYLSDLYVRPGGSPYVGRDYVSDLVKLAADGRALWTAVGKGGNPLAVDAVGSVYVPCSWAYRAETSSDAMIKFDANGNELWSHSNCWPVLRFDAAGNLYVPTAKISPNGHYFWWAADGAQDVAVDAGANVYAAVSDTVTKYDPNGNILWRTSAGASNSFTRIALDNAGNIYVAGTVSDANSSDFVIIKYTQNTNTVPGLPRITTQPSSQVVRPGANATLSVSAQGNPRLTYQWLFNGVALEGATNSALMLSNISPAQTGAYSVQVTNAAGNTISLVAFVTILYPLEPPIINRCITFTAQTSGAVPVEYQWQYNGANLPGATKRTLAFTNISPASVGEYTVIVTSFGNALTSTVARLNLPGIACQAWAARPSGVSYNYAPYLSLASDGADNAYVAYPEGYTTAKYASDGRLLWASNYYAAGYDYSRALAVDRAGNVFVTGISYGINGTGYDFATVKFDSMGNQVWVARYNGPANGEDGAFAIAVDASGNVYVTGYSLGGTGFDYLTIKYDPAGNQLWTARYEGPGHFHDFAYALALDNWGNAYVSGASSGDGTGYDSAVVKYDTSGNKLWAARYNGPGNGLDVGRHLTVDNESDVVVTGWSDGGPGQTNDFATIKYDPTGRQLWAARYNGPGSGEDNPHGVGVDSSGNVVVTGSSVGADGGFDFATVKYDRDGHELWVRRYSGPGNGNDYARALALDAFGNVYITGASDGDAETASDIATLKYDTTGALQWVARYDGDTHCADEPYALTVNSAGSIYVAGTTLASYCGSSSPNLYSVALKYNQIRIVPPRLANPALLPNGQFRALLLGQAGSSYTIQASADLVNWTTLTNFVSVTGTNQFTDPAAPNFSRRFYRAVTP